MPVYRASQLPRDRQPRTQPFGPVAVGDDWTPAVPFQLWGASKITVNVVANPVMLRFSRSQPPAPPEWDEAIPLQRGPYSHAGPFGYWQFRNAVPGAAGNVSGAAFAE